MRLTNNLFRIINKHKEGQTATYDLTLNANHTIYRAHFPDQPVTPGVCIIQMALELLEDHMETPMSIVSVKNAKFLNVLSPDTTPQATCQLTVKKNNADTVACTAIVTVGTLVMAKISFTCTQRRH